MNNDDIVFVSDDVTTDTTWGCDKVYVLEQATVVFVDDGATLTIEPGTTIRGSGGSALAVTSDGRLVAEGTADAPIVMTSNNVSSPAAADWGGLVLLGDATTNLGAPGEAEGFPGTPPLYGGNDDAHDCGSLAYLRVEYAGNEVSPGNELNGITFYGCGSETSVHHVQSHLGSDDGMEWFGGGFDADHLVVTRAQDDSFDIDEGFAGNLQFLYIHQDPVIGDNGFEISNQATDFVADPRTAPQIANATFIGSGASGDKSKGVNFKEGTHGGIFNSLFVNASNQGILVLQPETWAAMQADEIRVEGNLFFGTGSVVPYDYASFCPDLNPTCDPTPPTADDIEAWVLDDARGNREGLDPGLPSIDLDAPNLVPPTTSPAASGAVTLPGGFANAPFLGAEQPAASSPWTGASWIKTEG
jgi:hypothetical protein